MTASQHAPVLLAGNTHVLARGLNLAGIRNLAAWLDLLPLLAVAVMLGVMVATARPAVAQSPEDEPTLAAPAANIIQRAIVDTAEYIHVTFYMATGNPTASGEWPHDGTAGCSSDFALGTVFVLPDGRSVRCDDRGYDSGMAPHIDLYCAYDYATCMALDPWAANWTVPVPVMVFRGD